MEFWKTEEEYRVIQRIEVLDKIECDQCGNIITMDSADDTYIRAMTTVFSDSDHPITVNRKDWCKKCAIELVTREFLSHKNPNTGFSVDIRHLRKRNKRVVEENAKTHEPIDGSML